MGMIDDAELIEYYETARPKARRARLCDECRRTIARGETYRSDSGLFDGAWSRHAICAHCEIAASFLVVTCTGFCWTCVYEDLRNHWPTLASWWLGRVLVGMRRKWQRGDGGLMEIPKPFIKSQLPERYQNMEDID